MTTTTETNRLSEPAVPDRPPATADRDHQPGHGRPAVFLMAPFLILYLLFIIGPALYMVVMSFFDTSLTKAGLGGFAGFGNYAEALGSSVVRSLQKGVLTSEG